jgi:hypothetical protein
LPTRQQLELAAGAVVGPDGLRELVRATDGAVFAGNEPLDPRWEGDRKVGFRCVLQLERAK